MPPPTWAVGQVLAAADVNNWFVPVVGYKAASTARTSTTTMTNDPDLTIPVAANCIYQVRGDFFYDGASPYGTSDLKFTFTIPAGSSGMYYAFRVNTSGVLGNTTANNWTDTNTAGTSGVATTLAFTVLGTLDTAGTAGNLTLQWAQNTSSATATHMEAFCSLVAWRIT